ncbi:MAG: MurR/RpiR family transcriptional regulator [Oceanospirillales bacterium]|nr:MAG: MurR/RpiR family transcriptional regulator [Oceanospirillales bacterium]
MRRITETIRQYYDQLSPSERRVANFIVDHLDDLATYNSVELSQHCNTSKATISRLVRRLGYKNFKEVRDELKLMRQSGVPVPGPTLQVGSNFVDRHMASEMQNYQRLKVLLHSDKLNKVIELLSNAKSVSVIGFRNSYPVAMHLRQQLIQIRSNVYLLPLPGQTLGEELEDITSDDLVVLIAFHRRPSGFNNFFKTLIKLEVPVLLICEENSGLATEKLTDMLELPLDTISAFDSYALPMSLVSLMSNLLLHYQLDKGRARIEKINQLYDSTEELDINLSY